MADKEDDKTADSKPRRKPEYGADSQLHCYNAASWRLDQLFESDEPEPEPLKPASPKPKK